MKTQQTHHLIQKEVIAGFIILMVLATAGGGWWAWRSTLKPVSQPAVPSKVEQAPATSTQPTAIPAPAIKTAPQGIAPVIRLKPQSYWLQVKENGDIVLVPQQMSLKPGISQEVALKTAVNHLLRGTTASSEFSSTIPKGTRLLSLRTTKSGIYIDLSQEFASGGGSTSMIYRVAQVLYTASSLDSDANVYLSVEGKLLDADNPLGGEGIILTEPLTREKFAQDFSITTS